MLFKHAEIFTPQGFVRGAFTVEDGRFGEILPQSPDMPGADLGGARVIPGLIDIHNHGNSGADFSDGDPDGIRTMARYLARNGVTSFAPASMTLPYDVLARAFRALYEASEGLLRIVDVAAELPGAVDFAAQAAKLCTVSIAHTDCSYEDAAAVFAAGARHLTHLYNAMPGIHHRKPGPIGAASEREDVIAELICDGQHVHPSAVRMAFRLFPGRICLISDALRCCGMPDGQYTLGGQDVWLENNLARLADGTIAGSATNLYLCMQKAISFGIPMEQAIRSATIIPARQIGREAEIGSIEPGKLADFVVCAPDLTPKAVYLGGEIVE